MKRKKKQKINLSDKKILPKYKTFKNTANNLNPVDNFFDITEDMCFRTSEIVRYDYYFINFILLIYLSTTKFINARRNQKNKILKINS